MMKAMRKNASTSRHPSLEQCICKYKILKQKTWIGYRGCAVTNFEAVNSETRNEPEQLRGLERRQMVVRDD